MAEQNIKQKRYRHLDRVVLDSTALERIDNWIASITSSNKGVALGRKDLVNWLIQSHKANLSPDEIRELGRLYFNEVRFLQQTLKDLKKARAKGESFELKEFLRFETNTRPKQVSIKTKGEGVLIDKAEPQS